MGGVNRGLVEINQGLVDINSGLVDINQDVVDVTMSRKLASVGVEVSDGAVVECFDGWVLVFAVETSHDTIVVGVDEVGDRHARVLAVLGAFRHDDAVFLWRRRKRH